MTTQTVSGARLEMTETVNATIIKIEEDKQLVFGWANIIKTAEGKILLDRQDDFIDDENELEKAAYHYVLHSRDGGEMHLRKGVSTLVESVVLTDEKQRALGIPANTVPTGWWIGFKVNDESVWKQIKKGGYVGFSVHGTGRREKTTIDRHKYTDIEKGATKRDGGYDYPASAYAYVPDSEQPSTWKLRLWQTPEQKVTAKQVGMAIAALGPGGFRGNRVQLPSDAVAGVKRKVLSAWRSVHGKDEKVPSVLSKEEIMKYIKQKPNGKWCVYSESGKLLSEHNTWAEAKKRMAQIERFKKEQPTSSDVHVDSTEWDKRRRKKRILTNAALEKFNPNHDEAGRFSSGPGGGGGAGGRQPGGPKGGGGKKPRSMSDLHVAIQESIGTGGTLSLVMADVKSKTGYDVSAKEVKSVMRDMKGGPRTPGTKGPKGRIKDEGDPHHYSGVPTAPLPRDAAGNLVRAHSPKPRTGEILTPGGRRIQPYRSAKRKKAWATAKRKVKKFNPNHDEAGRFSSGPGGGGGGAAPKGGGKKAKARIPDPNDFTHNFQYQEALAAYNKEHGIKGESVPLKHSRGTGLKPPEGLKAQRAADAKSKGGKKPVTLEEHRAAWDRRAEEGRRNKVRAKFNESQRARQAKPKAKPKATKRKKSKSWQDYHDPKRGFTEDSVWQAIADKHGVDIREISDGDLVDYL